MNDQLNGTMCSGSGYVIRRKALGDIGGWPLIDAGDDYMCSTVMASKGWKVVLEREKLQYGLAPESFEATVKQRVSWVRIAPPETPNPNAAR